MSDFFHSSFWAGNCGRQSHTAALSWTDCDTTCDVGRGTEDVCNLPGPANVRSLGMMLIMPLGPCMPPSERLMHARHAGGFFYELVKYVTRSLPIAQASGGRSARASFDELRDALYMTYQDSARWTVFRLGAAPSSRFVRGATAPRRKQECSLAWKRVSAIAGFRVRLTVFASVLMIGKSVTAELSPDYAVRDG